MSGPALANLLWYLTCLPEQSAFRRAAGDVAAVQRDLLLQLVRRNAETRFGRAHGFAAIRTVADYQRQVPLTTYDDYIDAVTAISRGEPGVLTAEPVKLLELTSGSTAATKQIPYTAGLKAEFGRAIGAWIADLFAADPRLMGGQAYWSVTPVTQRNQRTPAGIPIGFEEDSEYLGGLQRRLVQSLMAVPGEVRLIDEMEAFRYATLLFLLKSRSLALVSVWNPTFLSLLLERLPGWWPALADDIEAGRLTPPAPVAADVAARLRAHLRPDSRRAAAVRAAFRAGAEPGEVHARLWPHLRLISCWTDGHAALHAPALARLLPQARIQGKGLIATEGFVSFPLTGHDGAALAVRSHFFEFLPEGGGPPLLGHELATGGRYAVVITTGGGLYRYRLQDIVEVTGRYRQAPLLRFLGKEAAISDRFGEKLHEGHVQTALDAACARFAVTPAFAMLACEEWAGRWAYTLFIEAPGVTDETLGTLGGSLEAALAENFHYRYCRDLGQLEGLRVFRVDGGAAESYLAACQARGQRAGDIKPVALHRLSGWTAVFRGGLVSR